MPTDVTADGSPTVVCVDLCQSDSDSDDERVNTATVDADWRDRVSSKLGKGARVKLEQVLDEVAAPQTQCQRNVIEELL